MDVINKWWVAGLVMLFFACGEDHKESSLAKRACECAEMAEDFKEDMFEVYKNAVKREALMEEAKNGDLGKCNEDMQEFREKMQNETTREEVMKALEDECQEVHEQLLDIQKKKEQQAHAAYFVVNAS